MLKLELGKTHKSLFLLGMGILWATGMNSYESEDRIKSKGRLVIDRIRRLIHVVFKLLEPT